jgi:hypothetical protein
VQKLARSPAGANDGKNRRIQGRSAKNWKLVHAAASRFSFLYYYDYYCFFFPFLSGEVFFNVWSVLWKGHCIERLFCNCLSQSEAEDTLRFDVLTAVKMSMLVFGVVTSCGLVGGY